MSAKLLVDGPGMWAFAHPLGPGTTVRVGRTPDNDLRLNDRAVSGKHAEIYEVAGTWYVRDAGSSNGTFVNGKKVRDTALKDGDVVKFGKCEVIFSSTDAGDSSERTWDDTKLEMERDATALHEIIERGSENDAAAIPSFIGRAKAALPPEKEVGIESAPSHPIRVTSAIPPSSSALIPPPAPRKPTPPPVPEELSPADTLWVASQLSTIVDELVRVSDADREQAISGILRHLIQALQTENAFVMIAEPATNRWVIRASIGNTDSWTSYEKDHPVPLTVANRAYTAKKVVSNALEGSEGGFDNSSSMMLLNVQQYIAVPLLVQDKRRGVLYFDTRQEGGKRFERKHVKLLERVGGYILDVERQ